MLKCKSIIIYYFTTKTSSTTMDDLCQAWLKLAQRFWRRFLNSFNEYLLLRYQLFWKRAWLFIWRSLNQFHSRMLCVSLMEIKPVALEKMKMWKVWRQTDGRWAIINLSYQIRWAKMADYFRLIWEITRRRFTRRCLICICIDKATIRMTLPDSIQGWFYHSCRAAWRPQNNAGGPPKIMAKLKFPSQKTMRKSWFYRQK